jgi:hypothetical protein
MIIKQKKKKFRSITEHQASKLHLLIKSCRTFEHGCMWCRTECACMHAQTHAQTHARIACIDEIDYQWRREQHKIVSESKG